MFVPVVGFHCSIAFEVKLASKLIWSVLDHDFNVVSFFVSAHLPVTLLGDHAPLN